MRLPDELATRLELLAHQRRKTMSVLLRDIIERYTARRYSPGRPRRRVHAEDVGVLSSVPALNSAESVAAAVPGAGLPLGADLESLPVLVFSSREEAHNVVASRIKEKYPGTARSAPCPCGSGEKYKRCCGKGARPKEL